MVSFVIIDICANMKAAKKPEQDTQSFFSIRESGVLVKLTQYNRGVEI